MKAKYYFLITALFALCISVNAQQMPVTFSTKGNSQQAASQNPAGNSVTDIITSGDTVWIGTSRGVSRSTDRGQSWVNYYGTPSFGNENIAALAGTNGQLWVSTAHSVDKDGQSLSEGSGLHYTTDNGQTWTDIQQPVDQPNDTVVIYGINRIRALPVTVAINNLAYDIAVTNKAVWIATFAGGLRKSTDMGKTWQRVVLPPDSRNSIKPTDTLNFSLQPVAGNFGKESNLNHRVFSVIAIDDNTIYVGTAGGINKSTDGGESWVKFNHDNQLNPISGNFVVAMAYNRQNNTLWGATWKAEGQNEYYAVSYSTDGGSSWRTSLSGEKAHNFGFAGTDAIALTDNGAFRTSNMGADWITPSVIMDDVTKLRLPQSAYYSAAAAGRDIYIGTDKGLARINETGGMWEGTWKIFIASPVLKDAAESYAFPNPFSPDTEPISIKYSTGGARVPVTIRIFDFGMNLVKTIIQNAERGSSIHETDASGSANNGVIDYWDGRDQAGNMVANGVYFYRIDIGSNKPLTGKIVVLM